MAKIREYTVSEVVKDVKIVELENKDKSGTFELLSIVLSDDYEIQLFLDRAELKILKMTYEQVNSIKPNKTILDD